MSTHEQNVFVNIGDHRQAIDAWIASQGLCQSDVPALRAAAKKFVKLTEAEAALLPERRERLQESRRAESARVLAAIDGIYPHLKPRRTLTSAVSEALRKHLEGVRNEPDVSTTFQELQPSTSALAR